VALQRKGVQVIHRILIDGPDMAKQPTNTVGGLFVYPSRSFVAMG
jgi:hypothetical protein